MLSWLIGLPRNAKRVVAVTSDLFAIPLTMMLAFALRHDGVVVPDARVATVLGLTTLTTVYVFARFGLYRAVIRHVGYQALMSIVLGVILSTLAFTTFGFMLQAGVPRSVPIIYFFLSVVAVGGSRFFVRALLNQEQLGGKEKVIIYGAGFGGLQLATALTSGAEYHPVAMVDDDRNKQGTVLQGLRVHKPRRLDRLVRETDAQKVLLAISRLTVGRRKKIVEYLAQFPVSVQTIPSYTDLISGRADIAQLRDVEVTDLLGRDSVDPDPALLPMTIQGKAVMVTGAGGSIGSELCRQILALRPSVLVLFEASEYGLYAIEKELQSLSDENAPPLVTILGSVQERAQLDTVIRHYSIATVFHAAAYKHVPLVELNLLAAARNNVLGTDNVARAALAGGVTNFILISTDKAVRPTNFMGASKRFAELILQALSAQPDCNTRFSMVRFGNVLASSGSVVPLFKKQIAEGGPLTVTHPEVNRYFMTIPEAVQLVIQAASMSRGGDVFVLDMGDPVRILDLATTMIRMMGKTVRNDDTPDGDIEIRFTGLRPGEKLYEELLIGDNCVGTEHPMITRATEHSLTLDEVEEGLVAVRGAIDAGQPDLAVEVMQHYVREYDAAEQIVDPLAAGASPAVRDNVRELFSDPPA